MTPSSALDLLAPELQRKILFQVDTLRELHSLIRASPRLFQVFLSNKEHVISTIARRQFHSVALPEALMFAKLSQHKQSVSQAIAEHYCNIKSSTTYEWQDSISSITESSTLCKLARTLKFFIEDYGSNTLPIIEELALQSNDLVIKACYPDKSFSYTQLSDSEMGRLQRAFCRFEMYRYLFARCFSGLDHEKDECLGSPNVKPKDQARFYLEKLPDFQITEIQRIRNYLSRRLRGICSQLENEALRTLSREDMIFGSRYNDIESLEWSSGLFLFTHSGKHTQPAHIEHLTSLGLPYIRKIFESTGDETKDPFIRHRHTCIIHYITERCFLTEALSLLGRNPAHQYYLSETDPPYRFQVSEGSDLGISQAWQWAHPQGPPHSLSRDTFRGLRDWGYVFWDVDRLRDAGILERSARDLRQVLYNEHLANQGLSVQEQLLGPPPYYAPDSEYDSDDSTSDADTTYSTDEIKSKPDATEQAEGADDRYTGNLIIAAPAGEENCVSNGSTGFGDSGEGAHENTKNPQAYETI